MDATALTIDAVMVMGAIAHIIFLHVRRGAQNANRTPLIVLSLLFLAFSLLNVGFDSGLFEKRGALSMLSGLTRFAFLAFFAYIVWSARKRHRMTKGQS